MTNTRSEDRTRDEPVPFDLETIREVYTRWGRHPHLYTAQEWITFLGRPYVVRRRAVGAGGIERGARVLEVGCGTGRNFRYIQERIGPEGRLVGFDYTEQMLEAARDLRRVEGWSNVSFIQGDAAVLDVGEEPFDAVLSILAMSVIPDYVAAIRRCHEVLRPGGTLAICDAQLFPGRLRVLNPLLRAVYVPTTAWAPDRDIPGAMREVFGDVSVERFNFGTLFIAASTKGGNS